MTYRYSRKRDLKYWLSYWREQLPVAIERRNREEFRGVVWVHDARIANYRRWITDAEAQLGLMNLEAAE